MRPPPEIELIVQCVLNGLWDDIDKIENPTYIASATFPTLGRTMSLMNEEDLTNSGILQLPNSDEFPTPVLANLDRPAYTLSLADWSGLFLCLLPGGEEAHDLRPVFYDGSAIFFLSNVPTSTINHGPPPDRAADPNQSAINSGSAPESPESLNRTDRRSYETRDGDRQVIAPTNQASTVPRKSKGKNNGRSRISRIMKTANGIGQLSTSSANILHTNKKITECGGDALIDQEFPSMSSQGHSHGASGPAPMAFGLARDPPASSSTNEPLQRTSTAVHQVPPQTSHISPPNKPLPISKSNKPKGEWVHKSCPLCRQMIRVKKGDDYNLRRHIQTIHPEEGKTNGKHCSICHRFISRLDNLSAHIRAMHPSYR